MLRLSYAGKVGKHILEIKKAVFVENTRENETVSLSTTACGKNNHNAREDKNKSGDHLGSPTEPEKVPVKSKSSAAKKKANMPLDR